MTLTEEYVNENVGDLIKKVSADVKAALKKWAPEEMHFFDGIGKYILDQLKTPKTAFKDLRAAFKEAWEKHYSEDYKFLHQIPKTLEDRERQFKFIARVSVDFFKSAFVFGVSVLPSPPGMVLVFHMLLKKITGVGLVPKSMLFLFKHYAENRNKDQQEGLQKFSDLL